jgi:hypothetical protein
MRATKPIIRQFFIADLNDFADCVLAWKISRGERRALTMTSLGIRGVRVLESTSL